MINSGQVRLRGSFSGAQVDFASRRSVPAARLIGHESAMVTSSDRRKFYVSGQVVELWRIGQPFGWAEEDLDGYARGGHWDLLFNGARARRPPSTARSATVRIRAHRARCAVPYTVGA